MAGITYVFGDWNSSTTGYGIYGYDSAAGAISLSISGSGMFTAYDYAAGTASFGNLTPSTSYTFSATAYEYVGGPVVNTMSSVFTTPSGAPTPVPPGSVSDLTATPHDGYVHLSWTAASNASFYRIYYKKESGTIGDIKTADVGNVTTSDIFDVINGKKYSFYVEAWNADGHGGASPVRYATPGPGRPSNFAWAYTVVSAGQPCGMDHRDWNFLTTRINMFRAYKINPSTSETYDPYGFTTASAGVFQAFYYRQAVNAIFEMSPPSAVPFLHYTDDYVYGWEVDQLRVALNSIP